MKLLVFVKKRSIFKDFIIWFLLAVIYLLISVEIVSAWDFRSHLDRPPLLQFGGVVLLFPVALGMLFVNFFYIPITLGVLALLLHKVFPAEWIDNSSVLKVFQSILTRCAVITSAWALGVYLMVTFYIGRLD